MTTEEFYAALEQKTRETGTVWTLQQMPHTDQLVVRASVGDEYRHCPLSFVAGTAPCHTTWAAAKLGLTEAVSWPIINAADSQYARERPRLLKACGLTNGH